MNKHVKLLCCAVGIFVSYFYVGVVTEKITKTKYKNGEKEEKFEYWLSLVFVQCVVNYVCAKVSVVILMRHIEDTTRLFYYASSALANTLAMIGTNTALQWVAYPTQVVVKSGKPIPVLLLGVLIGRRSYPWRKYLFVLMIVTGIIVFVYKDEASNSNSNLSYFGVGEVILLLSLLMDGVTGAIQERMRAEHRVKPLHLMLNMNFWAVIYIIGPILGTGEVLTFSSFLKRHPEVLWQIATLALAGVCGQFFIFTTVADFGPLPCSVITTSRKFFTVLGSVLIFGNILLLRQWIAAGVVFIGLGLDILMPDQQKEVAKLELMKAWLNKIVQEEGLPTDDELSDKLQQYLTGAPEFVQIFWEEHKKTHLEIATSDTKWHPLVLRWALSKMSADIATSEGGYIDLPSGRTLYEYTQVNPAQGSIKHEVIRRLSKHLQEIPPTTLHAYHVLTLAELNLFQNIIYHSETGEIIGYGHLDSAEEEVRRLEQDLSKNKNQLELEDAPVVTKPVLAFWAKSVVGSAKGIVAFIPADSLTMDILVSKTMDVIAQLELAGVRVIAFIGDGTPISADLLDRPNTRLTSSAVLETLSHFEGNLKIT